MNRVFTALLTAFFIVGFAGSALANHHKEDDKVDAHAQCTHAADEPCPHHADKGDAAAEKQCAKHAAGEECTCSGHEKAGEDHGSHS